MSTPLKNGRDESMPLDRLRHLLDAYGAAPAHWPAGERVAAESLIDSSPEARLMLAEATQLDTLLDLTRAPAPSEALAERLRQRRFGWRGLPAVLWSERFASRAGRWMVSPRHQAAALMAALAFGILVGVGIPDGDDVPAPAPRSAQIVRPAAAQLPVGAIAVGVREAGRNTGAFASNASMFFSSNSDPAFDAPDPFGAASHGLDLVDGARINGIPVPRAGEPMGSIPLL